MIVSLAGHVDHGKTSLVHALTGVNTDRLEEEQARGLTIDLGFAYIDEGRIGFVDVPGHHRFIHNMLAGIAADQLTLLVIAADDGPMPQSKEHLEILSMVGVRRGIVAITKCDRVDSARVAKCEEEIRDLLAGSFLQDAPILCTSIEDPTSIEHLLGALRDAQTDELDDHKPFRLAIDRRFTVKGAGVVVTGTVQAGAVADNEFVYHYPTDTQLRVRGLRAQNETVQRASRGDRCAINVTGLPLESIGRGDWITGTPIRRSREITVELDILKDFPRTLKQWTPVHIYHATSHATGHIALHAGSRLSPGSTKLVDLVCEQPLGVLHGDQLIIRDHGLDTTLGGGRVIFAQANLSPRRRTPERLAMLHAYHAQDPKTCMAKLLQAQAFEIEPFSALWQLDQSELANLLKTTGAIEIAGYAISQATLGDYAKEVMRRITEQQKNHPSSRGLKANAFGDIPDPVINQVLSALVQNKRLAVLNGVYGLTTHTAELPVALAGFWQKLQKSLDTDQPPSSGDLAKAWKQAPTDMHKQLRELAKRGLIVQIADHRFYLPEQLEQIAKTVARMAKSAPFTVREFRDQTGIGRNVAIDILEFFDSKGFTRRQDNHRKLLREHL